MQPITLDELKTKSITELQALAYQQLVAKTNAERGLQVIEEIIAQKNQAPQQGSSGETQPEEKSE